MLKISSPRSSFSSSTKLLRSRNLRSVSFPARSSSNVHKLEQELDKLNSSFEPSSSPSSPLEQGIIIARLSGVSEVYRRIGDLLSQPGAHQALTKHQETRQWAHHTSDDLIRYLDVCTNTRDTLLAMQEKARDILSAIRRSSTMSKGSSSTNITGFLASRKKAKKEAAKSLASLKQAGAKLDCSRVGSSGDDLYAVATVGAVREASFHTVSVFGEMLASLSAKSKTGGKWSLVAKLVHIKGCESDSNNKKKMSELESVEAALHDLCSSTDGGSHEYMAVVELAQRRLEKLDKSIGGVEKELECLFRRLIQARVSLLNLLSH
ncbi:hypothetical protein LINPERPRIM_LOCUS2631 [Linum perenne]